MEQTFDEQGRPETCRECGKPLGKVERKYRDRCSECQAAWIDCFRDSVAAAQDDEEE